MSRQVYEAPAPLNSNPDPKSAPNCDCHSLYSHSIPTPTRIHQCTKHLPQHHNTSTTLAVAIAVAIAVAVALALALASALASALALALALVLPLPLPLPLSYPN